jgi:hypothetical protein
VDKATPARRLAALSAWRIAKKGGLQLQDAVTIESWPDSFFISLFSSYCAVTNRERAALSLVCFERFEGGFIPLARFRYMTRLRTLSVLAALPLWAGTLSATTLTFEGLGDQQPVGSFYAGVTFTNAIAAIAGQSLNEFELPPASGVTVALNDGGAMVIEWSAPVINFSGLFTYTAPLTLNFFLGGSALGNSVASAFGNNLAISGEPGSAPNEAISFGGILFDSVLIGVADGGAYGVDDVLFGEGTGPQGTPEPATFLPVMMGLAGLLGGALRYRRSK